MFFNALYCFGYLPKAIQLIVLIIFSIITIKALSHLNGNEADPFILIVGFYFLRRLLEWVVSFKIHDLNIPFLIIALIASLIFMVKRIKFIGILVWLIIVRLIFIWNGQLSMLYGAILTIISIIFLKPLLNLSKGKILFYIALGCLIGFRFGSLIGIEAIILAELFIRCSMQRGFTGIFRFLSLIISIFTFSYLIELSFAHTPVIISLIVIVWLLNKAIG